MKGPDEPIIDWDDIKERAGAAADAAAVQERVRHLVENQPYAVLCTQGDGQPYGSLVAFAFSQDLRHAVFVTPVATRKYRLLRQCDQVALVIDNRPNNPDQLMDIEAVTGTGRSQMIERGDEFDQWAGLLVTRHPYLETFVNASACALFRIDIVRFLHVGRFQEVNRWIPDAQA